MYSETRALEHMESKADQLGSLNHSRNPPDATTCDACGASRPEEGQGVSGLGVLNPIGAKKGDYH